MIKWRKNGQGWEFGNVGQVQNAFEIQVERDNRIGHYSIKCHLVGFNRPMVGGAPCELSAAREVCENLLREWMDSAGFQPKQKSRTNEYL